MGTARINNFQSRRLEEFKSHYNERVENEERIKRQKEQELMEMELLEMELIKKLQNT